VVCEALMGADKRAQGLRDGAGAEEGRPGPLCVQLVLEPLVGLMRRALGTMPVPAGRRDTVVRATPWALREAVALVSALARLDGVEDCAV
jgi:hypothetical protein